MPKTDSPAQVQAQRLRRNEVEARRILSWNKRGPLLCANPKAAVAACRYACQRTRVVRATGARRQHDGTVVFRLADGTRFPPVTIWNHPYEVVIENGESILLFYVVKNPIWWQRLWRPRAVVSIKIKMMARVTLQASPGPKGERMDVRPILSSPASGDGYTTWTAKGPKRSETP